MGSQQNTARRTNIYNTLLKLFNGGMGGAEKYLSNSFYKANIGLYQNQVKTQEKKTELQTYNPD